MRRPWLILIAVIALFPIGGAGRQPEFKVRLFVPAYFYPAGEGLKEWDKLFASPARSAIVVIVNPASGPGRAADPNYVEILRRARRASVLPIGYVTTSYAKRPLAEVKAEIDHWLALYPGIQGIFFDEQASADAHVDYQATLYEYVRKSKGLELVVSNPGTVCAEGYLTRPAADAVCLFEGPLTAESLHFPPWTARLPRGRIAVVPYQVDDATAMRRCLRTAAEQGAGLVYITDANGSNPWRRLPRYWDQESATLIELNREANR